MPDKRRRMMRVLIMGLALVCLGDGVVAIVGKSKMDGVWDGCEDQYYFLIWWNGLEMICWFLWCAAAKIWSWYEMLLYRIGVVCGEICSWQERVWVLTCCALLYVAACPWHLVQTLPKEEKQTKDIKQHKHMTPIFLGPASTNVETAMPCHFTNRYICKWCLPMCICLECTHPSNAQLQMWVQNVAHTDVSENSGTPKWMIYNGKPY